MAFNPGVWSGFLMGIGMERGHQRIQRMALFSRNTTFFIPGVIHGLTFCACRCLVSGRILPTGLVLYYTSAIGRPARRHPLSCIWLMGFICTCTGCAKLA